LPKPLDIQNLVSDTATINSAAEKIDKNKQWIKFRSTDIYIDESVRVLNKMISQNNMARTDF
jgi:carboxyl-terminal processing protease